MIFLIAAVLVALDQLTKVLAVSFLKGQPSFVLWEGVFQLTYVTNKGTTAGCSSSFPCWPWRC